MAQNTRRSRTEENAMARELYNRSFSELTTQEQHAVTTAVRAAQNAPHPEETEVTGEGSLRLPAAGETDPTADTGPALANGGADTPDAGSPENAANGTTKVTPADIRAWAQKSGKELTGHGRIPAEVTTEYLAAHPGHEVTAGPSKGPSKPFIPVPEDILNFEEVPETEWESHPLSDGPAPRDPVQVRFDERVKTLHDKWIAAGKPEVRKAPRDRIAVEQQYGPAVRRMLGAAASHHKVQIKVQPVSHDQQGRQVIVFTAIDKPVKAKPEEKPETETKDPAE